MQIEELVTAARTGNQNALEELVRHIQDRIYRLAIRMLVCPEEAQVATQEILIIVVTKLSTFQGKSAFTTWVYRIAINYLIAASKRRKEQLNFEQFAQELEEGLADTDATTSNDQVLMNEVRVLCTMAMLLCLDAEHRAAYVLGEIFEFSQGEASSTLSLSPANYRQRLARARKSVVEFTSRSCGLVSDKAACHCSKRVKPAIELGRVRPDSLFFSRGAPTFSEIEAQATRLASQLCTIKLQRATPEFRSQIDFGKSLVKALEITS